MAKSGQPSDRKIYDGKLLWETYMGWGAAATYKKLRAFAREKGMVNPETGQVSHMGVYFAAWKYAFRNPYEAHKSYKEWRFQTDRYLPSFRDFLLEIQNHAYNNKSIATSDKAYEEFCRTFDLDPLPPRIRINLESAGWRCPVCGKMNPMSSERCGANNGWKVGCNSPRPENTVLPEEEEHLTDREYIDSLIEKIRSSDELPSPELLRMTAGLIELERDEEANQQNQEVSEEEGDAVA